MLLKAVSLAVVSPILISDVQYLYRTLKCTKVAYSLKNDPCPSSRRRSTTKREANAHAHSAKRD